MAYEGTFVLASKMKGAGDAARPWLDEQGPVGPRCQSSTGTVSSITRTGVQDQANLFRSGPPGPIRASSAPLGI